MSQGGGILVGGSTCKQVRGAGPGLWTLKMAMAGVVVDVSDSIQSLIICPKLSSLRPPWSLLRVCL